RDEAAGAEHDLGRERAQGAHGADHPHGDVHGEITDVLPRPVAPELAGRDGDVGDAGLWNALRLDAGVRANPRATDRTLAKEGRPREARARVSSRAAARDDDVGGHAVTQPRPCSDAAPGRARSGDRPDRRRPAPWPPTSWRRRSSR